MSSSSDQKTEIGLEALKAKSTVRSFDNFKPMIIVVGALALTIQIASQFVPPFVMPAPVDILKAVWKILENDSWHIAVTALRLLLAISFALVAGVLIGVIMGMFPRVRPYLGCIITIDTGIPALSWMLLAIFWFREPEVRIFFILSVILIPFYATSVFESIRGLSRDYIDMLESFRPRRMQSLRYLIIPHIVPDVLTTTKSIVGYGIRMAVFAELLASAIGVGSRMSLAQSNFRVDEVLAWTLVLVVANLGLQELISNLDKVLLRWRPEVVVR